MATDSLDENLKKFRRAERRATKSEERMKEYREEAAKLKEILRSQFK